MGRRAGRGGAPLERLYGVHPVREALRARRRRLLRLWLREGVRGGAAALRAAAERIGVPVSTTSRAELELLLAPGAAAAHQGVVLEVGSLPCLTLEALLGRGEAGARRLVALDGVEDPQNLGSIARSAEVSGAGGLLLPERRAAPPSPAASRASAGALEHLPLGRVTNLGRALDALAGAGFWRVGADPEEGVDLFATPAHVWRGDLVLVFGAEGRGLRPGVARRLDHRIAIPRAGKVASLNVAAAAAVVLFEALRRSRGG